MIFNILLASPNSQVLLAISQPVILFFINIYMCVVISLLSAYLLAIHNLKFSCSLTIIVMLYAAVPHVLVAQLSMLYSVYTACNQGSIVRVYIKLARDIKYTAHDLIFQLKAIVGSVIFHVSTSLLENSLYIFC